MYVYIYRYAHTCNMYTHTHARAGLWLLWLPAAQGVGGWHLPAAIRPPRYENEVCYPSSVTCPVTCKEDEQRCYITVAHLKFTLSSDSRLAPISRSHSQSQGLRSQRHAGHLPGDLREAGPGSLKGPPGNLKQGLEDPVKEKIPSMGPSLVPVSIVLLAFLISVRFKVFSSLCRDSRLGVHILRGHRSLRTADGRSVVRESSN